MGTNEYRSERVCAWCNTKYDGTNRLAVGDLCPGCVHFKMNLGMVAEMVVKTQTRLAVVEARLNALWRDGRYASDEPRGDGDTVKFGKRGKR